MTDAERIRAIAEAYGVHWLDTPEEWAKASVRPLEILAAVREDCARIADSPMQEVMLHCGEMSAVERRAVRAVLGWVARAIRAGGA